MWCRSHHSGGVSQPGKRASVVAGDQGDGLSEGGDPPHPAQVHDDTCGVDGGEVDVGLVGEPEGLLGADQGAVGGDGVAGVGQQIVEVDGDDHRRRGAAGVGQWSVGAQESVADVFEGVVHPLPVGAGVGGRRPGRRSGRARCCGLASGSSSAWSLAPASPVSRNSPAHAPSLVGRRWKCRRAAFSSSCGRLPSGSMWSTTCSARRRRSWGPKRFGEPGQQLLPGVQVGRVEPAVIHPGQGPFDDRHLLRGHLARALRRGQLAVAAGPAVPRVMLLRSPTAAAARTRRDASAGDRRSVAHQGADHVALGQHVGQVPPLRVGDQPDDRPTASGSGPARSPA